MASSDNITMSPFGENKMIYFYSSISLNYSSAISESIDSINGAPYSYTIKYIPLKTGSSSGVTVDNYTTFDIDYGVDDFGIYFSIPSDYNGGLRIIDFYARLCSMYDRISGLLGLDFISYYDSKYYPTLFNKSSLAVTQQILMSTQYGWDAIYSNPDCSIPYVMAEKFYPCLRISLEFNSNWDTHKDNYIVSYSYIGFNITW